MDAALPGLAWNSAQTPFVFYTGKGGVGKTTVAAATAVALADAGRRVLLVSTDPASNLDDVLGTPVGPGPTVVPDVTGLEAMNLDPDAAAAAYRRRVIEPYRASVSAEQLRGIEEQLAGECTVEVAAFDLFTQLMVHPELSGHYDHVLFDTAPTGHTLRLLNLPSAWSRYIDVSPDGASCLGPRSGLHTQREQYHAAVEQLRDPSRTTLVLVTRPEPGALREAARASGELAALGIDAQHLVINGRFATPLAGDPLAEAFAHRQLLALRDMPDSLRALPASAVPLTAIDLTGIPALRALAADRQDGPPILDTGIADRADLPDLDTLVRDVASAGPGAVLIMGKGGVGKTTIAAALAVGLAHRGHDVHLSTTDPAGRLTDVLLDDVPAHLTVSRIDPAAELARYTAERLKAADRLDPDRKALLEEDLRSPCTQEMAVFRAFSSLLTEARQRFVVIDTAPSGHTLRLLDLTGSYHRQVLRGAAKDMHATTPLMRLQDSRHTRVLIVALPDVTPVSEAAALQEDLRRAGIEPYGWVINASLAASGTRDPLLRARAALEHRQLTRVRDRLAARIWLVPWQVDALTGEERLAALSGR
jgi:arsenite/tail-anchored protein-transporting ATPase